MLQEICINVSIVDDSVFEDAETFRVSLRVDQVVRSAVSIHNGETAITILDNDNVRLSLAAASRTVPESIGTVEVCVQLNGQTQKPIPYQLTVIPDEGKWFRHLGAPEESR